MEDVLKALNIESFGERKPSSVRGMKHLKSNFWLIQTNIDCVTINLRTLFGFTWWLLLLLFCFY